MIAQPNKKIILNVNKELKHDYWKNKNQIFVKIYYILYKGTL